MKEKGLSAEQLKKERDEYLQGWQRERADLANYKREAGEQARRSREKGTEEALSGLLPILDTLELAESSATPQDQKSPVVKGCLQIARQIRELLKERGVKELEATGPFTPELHEAVGEVQAQGVRPGDVAEVVAKGYTFHGKVMRAAKVKVAK